MPIIIPGSGDAADLLVGNRIRTQNGRLIVPADNYLSRFVDASAPLGTVGTAVVTLTGNRTTATTTWASTATANISIAQSGNTELRGAFNYLFTGASALGTGATFVETPVFTIEGTDAGKPLFISFDLKGVTADGNFDVAVVRYDSAGTYIATIPVAGNASGATVPSAKLPTGTGTFRGFFVPSSTTTDLYALRFRRLAGSDVPRIDTLYVGPQTQLLGAAVTDFLAFQTDPTPVNFGTVTNAFWRYKRVGDVMHVRGAFQAGITVAATASLVINGFTIDSTKAATALRSGVGSFELAQSSGTGLISSTDRQGKVFVDSTDTTSVYFAIQTSTTGFAKNNAGALAASSSFVIMDFQIPISTWSSNVTMGERSLEEYAADDGTSDVFGPNGALVPSVALGAGLTSRVFAFSTTKQATDMLVLEYNLAGNGWSVSSIYPYIAGNAGFSYGIRGYWTSATTYEVNVGNGGLSPNSGLGVSGTDSWASAATAGHRFRVRKVSSGAAIGGAIGARNVVGDVSGTAVPSGYIGERLSVVNTTVSNAVFATAFSSGTVSLTPGVYDLFGVIAIAAFGTLSGVNLAAIVVRDGAATSLTGAVYGDNRVDTVANNVSGGSATVGPWRVNVTATTTYHAVGRIDATSGTGTAHLRIIANRIA